MKGNQGCNNEIRPTFSKMGFLPQNIMKKNVVFVGAITRYVQLLYWKLNTKKPFSSFFSNQIFEKLRFCTILGWPCSDTNFFFLNSLFHFKLFMSMKINISFLNTETIRKVFYCRIWNKKFMLSFKNVKKLKLISNNLIINYD